MSRARDNANLGAQAGSGLDASDITSGALPVGVTGGSGLNALSASNLSAGTVPDARFPATLPAASGTNLTALPADELSGTITSGTQDAITRLGTVTTGTIGGSSVVNTSGAITTTAVGGFTSVGIDDNANALAMTIDASENVGIGVTVPASRLHISGSNNTLSSLTLTNTAPDPDNVWSFVPVYNVGDLVIRDDDVDRMKIDSSGDVTVSTGDLIFGTAGKGVVLGATTNVDANTLDDYEEGTWTPVWSSDNASALPTTSSISSNDGHYTKIGQCVILRWYLYATINTIGSGSLLVGGLPFAPGCSTTVDNHGMGVHVSTSYPYIPNGRHPRIYSSQSKFGWLGNTSAGAGWAWETTSALVATNVSMTNGTLVYFTQS